MCVFRVFILIPMLFFVGCHGSNYLKKEECLDSLLRANRYLNEYYTDGDEENLKRSISIIDNVIDNCLEHKEQLVTSKINVLMLLKDYEKGYEFVKSLETEKFKRSYSKNMYLMSFKALYYETKKDILSKNAILQNIVEEIQDYVDHNPTDEEAIIDLFYTKTMLKTRKEIINEIDKLLEEKKMANDNFYILLKESIENFPHNNTE